MESSQGKDDSLLIQNPDNSMLDVDKIMLFGILYTSSKLGSTHGNMAKGILFWHLLQKDDIIKSIKRDSKRLKMFIY